MNRSQARAAAKAALQGLALFKLIKTGTAGTFGGASPVAIITSGGIERVRGARAVWSDVDAIRVTVYVARPAGSEEAAEDTLDAAVLATLGALDGLHDSIVFRASDATQRNRLIDGIVYRNETLTFSVIDEVAA